MNNIPLTHFISNYFVQTKIESTVFIFLGIVSIAFALINWCIIKYSFYKGLAYPLMIVGALQLVVGTSVFMDTSHNLARMETLLQSKSQNIKTEEIQRTHHVITCLSTYKWIECALVITGLLLLWFFKKKATIVFWKGVGLGLFIEASVLLLFNIIAETQALHYLYELEPR